ncbi:hypothetical protein GGR52DRAFT_78189 [Hypoxylon sp. FL1284]|nr:hypothetical protein GGR52DRAFT_78189 [Hypoxylon sp. FL1284]
MGDSSTFLSNGIQDIEDNGSELLDGYRVKIQPHDREDALPTAQLAHSCADTPRDPSTKSMFIHTSERPTTRRMKNRTAMLHSNSAKLSSPGLSIGSSTTPETRTSQHTATSEDEPANLDNSPAHISIVDGVPSPNIPLVKRKRQRKKKAEEDGFGNMDVAKRNRFLEKNRAAATKCRQKKKEWVSELEEARFGLESQNNHLQMEYSSLRNEITQIKSQLMEHASCNDHNIDKWIENEAKRYVLGASERYDQVLNNLGSAPGMMGRQESFSSASGYPIGPGSDLVSPVTPSHRGSFSFPTGAMVPSSPIFYHPDLASEGPASALVEEAYPSHPVSSTMTNDPTRFDSGPTIDDTFQGPTISVG